MSFACQKNSYATSLSTRVVSCKPAQVDGRDCYEVILEDTVLFPEGGGQPDDRGTIGGHAVLRVLRRGSQAVHYTSEPLEEGSEVHLEVDWKRRFDHMQQHSGQHLITAVADKLYGFKTTSWNLAIGEDNKCFIELNTKNLTSEQIRVIEKECNSDIQACTSVNVRWLQPEDPELAEVRGRGLPDDHEGTVRVVEMVGVDTNMCCGTHVSNLSHIQAVKLLHTESKHGSTLLYFVSGNRVCNLLEKCYQNERALTKMLSSGPEDHLGAVKKLQEESRASAKHSRTLLRDLAVMLSSQHLQQNPPHPLAVFHRDDGDGEFMNILGGQLSEKGVLTFVTVGGSRGPGLFLLAGKVETVKELGPKIADMLSGKGGGKGGKFQGKCQKLENRGAVEQLLRETVEK